MNWKENFKKNNSFDFWIIHISFAFIIGLQAYFYKESTCIMDNAYYLFDMINREAFTIPHHRFIAVFAEFLPWLAIQLHLPLKFVFIGFSINFLVTTYLIFLIVWFQTKDIANGYFLLFSALFLAHHQFFFRSPEYIAIPFCYWFFISLDLLKNKNNRGWFIQSFLLLTIIALGSHTLIYLVLLYVLLYQFFQYPVLRKNIILFGICFFVFVYVKKIMFPINGYEQSKIDIFFNALTHWKDIKKSNFLYFYREAYRMNYFYNLTNFILLIAVILSIYKKRFLSLLCTISFVIGLFFVNSIMFLEENNTYMHYELYFYMIASILGIFFYQNVSHTQYIKRMSFVYFFLIGIFFFWQSHFYFKSRFDYLDAILKQSKHHKIAIPIISLNWNKLSNSWAIDVETILISSLHGDTKTLFPMELESVNNLNKKESSWIFSTFKDYKSENLNSEYFNLPNEKYTIYTIE